MKPSMWSMFCPKDQRPHSRWPPAHDLSGISAQASSAHEVRRSWQELDPWKSLLIPEERKWRATSLNVTILNSFQLLTRGRRWRFRDNWSKMWKIIKNEIMCTSKFFSKNRCQNPFHCGKEFRIDTGLKENICFCLNPWEWQNSVNRSYFGSQLYRCSKNCFRWMDMCVKHLSKMPSIRWTVKFNVS